MMAYFRLRPEGYAALKELVGSDRKIAKRLGVDPSTVHRVLNGQEVTARLITGAVTALGPSWLNILFEAVAE
ncbi:hypothetical protein KL953_08635 [Mycolicibacterium goodii]|uniref:hypothetical protein n=1 Tax=Mycolicibacterium goodii TaxID=134601 RepID=UPI001BDCBED3|nr:hypothetical protein [Mycolicibacterium goodii]MBU8808961.1 hypothetical protein [Mycolicibacterium goodii]